MRCEALRGRWIEALGGFPAWTPLAAPYRHGKVWLLSEATG